MFIIILGLLFKMLLFPIKLGDYNTYLGPWVKFIAENGFLESLKYDFYNYSPSYIYILILIAKTGLNSLYMIKATTVLVEFILAFYVSKILFLKHQNKNLYWISIALLPLLPTIILNGACLGQCDVIYSSFVVAGIYYSLINKQFISVLLLSIGIAFKIQAVFILPYYFILLLTGRTKWYYFFLIPLVYFISIVPAWLYGRDLFDLLSIYLDQSDYYQMLTVFMPNIYIWFQDLNYLTFKIAGIILTIILTLGAGIYIKIKNIDLRMDTLVILAFSSLIICPFILPGMHERYLYLSDVFAFIFIFWFRKNIRIPIGMLFVSFYAYISCSRFKEVLPLWPAFIIYLWMIVLILKEISSIIKSSEQQIES